MFRMNSVTDRRHRVSVVLCICPTFVLLSFLFTTPAGGAFIGAPLDGVSDLIYVRSTGELVVDPDGVAVGGLQIKSASGAFDRVSAALPAAEFRTDSNFQLGFAHPMNLLTDAISLGEILAPGLSTDFLLDDLTVLRGNAGLGTSNRDFNLITIDEVTGSRPWPTAAPTRQPSLEGRLTLGTAGDELLGITYVQSTGDIAIPTAAVADAHFVSAQ